MTTDCVITGRRDCRDRNCELHYMDAPLKLERTRTETALAAGAGLAFIALVLASNWLTARYGLVLGLVTAGTFTAGLTLAARDTIHRTVGPWVSLICVAIGAGLSAWLASPALAIASVVAFTVSELADLAVYAPLYRRGKLRALAASNAVGAVVDSALFLAIAGFPIWPALGSQVAVKSLVAVLLPLLVIGGFRALLRHRLRAQGA